MTSPYYNRHRKIENLPLGNLPIHIRFGDSDAVEGAKKITTSSIPPDLNEPNNFPTLEKTMGGGKKHKKNSTKNDGVDIETTPLIKYIPPPAALPIENDRDDLSHLISEDLSAIEKDLASDDEDVQFPGKKERNRKNSSPAKAKVDGAKTKLHPTEAVALGTIETVSQVGNGQGMIEKTFSTKTDETHTNIDIVMPTLIGQTGKGDIKFEDRKESNVTECIVKNTADMKTTRQGDKREQKDTSTTVHNRERDDVIKPGASRGYNLQQLMKRVATAKNRAKLTYTERDVQLLQEEHAKLITKKVKATEKERFTVAITISDKAAKEALAKSAAMETQLKLAQTTTEILKKEKEEMTFRAYALAEKLSAIEEAERNLRARIEKVEKDKEREQKTQPLTTPTQEQQPPPQPLHDKGEVRQETAKDTRAATTPRPIVYKEEEPRRGPPESTNIRAQDRKNELPPPSNPNLVKTNGGENYTNKTPQLDDQNKQTRPVPERRREEPPRRHHDPLQNEDGKADSRAGTPIIENPRSGRGRETDSRDRNPVQDQTRNRRDRSTDEPRGERNPPLQDQTRERRDRSTDGFPRNRNPLQDQTRERRDRSTDGFPRDRNPLYDQTRDRRDRSSDSRTPAYGDYDHKNLSRTPYREEEDRGRGRDNGYSQHPDDYMRDRGRDTDSRKPPLNMRDLHESSRGPYHRDPPDSRLSESILRDLARNQTLGGNSKNGKPECPTGFTDQDEIDSLAPATYIKQIEDYFVSLCSAHSSMSKPDINNLGVESFKQSLEKERIRIAQKFKRGDEKLPIQIRLESIRKMRKLTPLSKMQSMDEIVEALKSTYMTAQQISAMEKKFNNLSQGSDSFSMYVYKFTDALQTLLETDKTSGYQGNEEKQILQFIQGITDLARQETLQEKNYTVMADLMEKCENIIKNMTSTAKSSDKVTHNRPPNSSPDKLQQRTGVPEESAKPKSGNIASRLSRTDTNKKNTSSKNTSFDVFCFRHGLQANGVEICTRCAGDHYCYDSRTNTQLCPIDKDSQTALELREATNKDVRLGYNKDNGHEYITAYYERKKERKRARPDDESDVSAPERGAKSPRNEALPHRLSGANTVRMNTGNNREN